MLKRLITFLLACYAAIAMAATDANKASLDELTAIKGIGPATANRIVEARAQGSFKNWDDLIARVKGIAHASAAKLSEAGLTVNGQPYATTPKAAASTEGNAKEKSAKPAASSHKKSEKS